MMAAGRNIDFMEADKKKIWFPAKRYGWGWGLPCSWEGWVVMAVWMILLIGGFLVFDDKVFFVAYMAALTVGLMIVCFLKGEKPRWRWGGTDK
ncbi:MAG: hypothetical protein WCD79_15075 [Chthoniobacteraceae bacterium]